MRCKWCIDCGKQLSDYYALRCKSCARKGQHQTEEAKKKISISHQGEKNGKWKGDKIKSYGALHRWIERHKPSPLLCVKCKKREPYDLANISGNYKRDINDFEWLCRRCHMDSDGRIKNLELGRLSYAKM